MGLSWGLSLKFPVADPVGSRRRSRGGCAVQTEAEELHAGSQATPEALSAADKTALGVSPGGGHMSLKLAAFSSDPIDRIAYFERCRRNFTGE